MLTFWSAIQMHTFVSVIFHILSFGLLSLHCQCVMDQMQLKIRPSISSVLWIAIFTQHPLQCDCHDIHYKSKLCNQNCFFFAFCEQLLGTNIIIRERGHFAKVSAAALHLKLKRRYESIIWFLKAAFEMDKFLFMVLFSMMLLCNRPKKAYFLQFGFRTSDLCHSMSFPGTIAEPVCPSSSL